MIRKCTSDDHIQIMSFLMEKKIYNLFIIGDILNFGYDKEFQEIWGDFEETSGTIRGILLRYYENFLPYGISGFDLKGFADIILSYKPNFKYMNVIGTPSIISDLETFQAVPENEKILSYLCEYTTPTHVRTNPNVIIKKATLEDLPRILELRNSIHEFSPNPTMLRSLVKSFENHSSRHYFIEDNNKIVAAVSSTAENPFGTVITGVCTHKDYRRQGFITTLMQHLCQELKSEGKTVALFYHNPEAGSIYHRMGFKTIDEWVLYR